MREFDARLISEPAGIDPSARSDPAVPLVTVFPLAVVVGLDGAGLRGGVVVLGGVLAGVLTVVLAGVLTVVPDARGVAAAGAVAAGDSRAGTS